MAKIDTWLTELADLKDEIAEKDERRKELESKIIEYLDGNETSAIEWEHYGKSAKASVVRSSTIKIDEEGLLAELPARTVTAITTRVIDRKALEDKVARGQIDVNLVAKYTDEVAKKPYVRVTKK